MLYMFFFWFFQFLYKYLFSIIFLFLYKTLFKFVHFLKTMQSKATLYTNKNNDIYYSIDALIKVKHVHNAPYALVKANNDDDIHFYQINKSKYHSLKKQENQMMNNNTNTNDIWIQISTINNKCITWSDIEVILYSSNEHLLWFISDHSDYYYYKIMGYSIETKISFAIL